MANTSLHFHRLGRAWHPVVPDAIALAEVPLLDEALWVATAAPIDTLKADPVFLRWLDLDNDGRVRADELRAGIRWLFELLTDPHEVREGNTTLLVAKINDQPPEGASIVRTARRLTSEPNVELSSVRDARKKAEDGGLSEADRVLPLAAANERTRSFIEHLIDVVGGEAHPCGGLAISEARLVKYLDQLNLWLSWSDRARAEEQTLLPLQDRTAEAHAALAALEPKLEQYFLLCDAVRLDPRVSDLWHPNPATVDLLDTEAVRQVMLRSPVAVPRPDGNFLFDEPSNPMWTGSLRAALPHLQALLKDPDLRTLTRDRWQQAWGTLDAYRAWIAQKPETRLESCNAEFLHQIANDTSLIGEVRHLLAESVVAAEELKGIRVLEKLILYQAWMLPFANSFVAHPDLYDVKRTATYEMGTVILDGRRFNLAVKVPDAARHEKFAAEAGIFVMYVQVGKTSGTWDFEVAVPVTAGERGSLIEGMWGIFIDHEGKQSHAKVRKMIVNPISIKEALVQPIYRAAAGISGMIDKAGAAQEAALAQSITAKAQAGTDAAAAGKLPPTPPPAPPAASIGPTQLAGVAAGAGIALAALGSALTYVTETFWGSATALAKFITTSVAFTSLPTSAQTPIQVLSYPVSILIVLLGFVGLPILIYTIPVSIAAWLKLRRRDLSALLEGSGWAINARMYVTKELAGRFTQRPPIPLHLPGKK